ncbi:MAG: hypothetical protein QNL98_15170 [Mycobacterium sp.]
MPRRILTEREQVAMTAPWRVGCTPPWAQEPDVVEYALFDQ